MIGYRTGMPMGWFRILCTADKDPEGGDIQALEFPVFLEPHNLLVSAASINLAPYVPLLYKSHAHELQDISAVHCSMMTFQTLQYFLPPAHILLSSVGLYPSFHQMSNFVPDLLDDCPSPLGEESRNPEHPQDPGGTNLVISEMVQVVIMTMLATLYLVIAMLFRFATSSVPGTLDVILPPLIAEPSHPELPRDLGETLSGIQHIAIISIHTTGLTLGVRRIPAGFHVTVTADGAEWQTSNLLVHIDQAVMEWNERILL
ncbi:hypothetical protein DFJ58DRAFT_847327 [Suillus subalutaceus]|uniref:uncharacterized protein n=1 Tax=Suillus subalutaceus TaxID=48586 RepID=UPI001B878C96|nr:uncharacterized protein DFJ58DRAFT_847327 [Suillus subalutaceus]KAG1835826.1 hypothetical protein DFJ58DRAFT_847327 [Suillus subalutaceus]